MIDELYISGRHKAGSHRAVMAMRTAIWEAEERIFMEMYPHQCSSFRVYSYYCTECGDYGTGLNTIGNIMPQCPECLQPIELRFDGTAMWPDIRKRTGDRPDAFRKRLLKEFAPYVRVRAEPDIEDTP